MLERALTQPHQCSLDPLSNAFSWGIPIWTPHQFQIWIDKISESLKLSQQCIKSDCSKTKNFKVKLLKEPYIKFESYRRYIVLFRIGYVFLSDCDFTKPYCYRL